MKVLLLSPYPERLRPAIEAAGDEIVAIQEPLEVAVCRELRVDWIVSYGYRHIIRAPVLDVFPSRVVNLHISYLPWNRGADPNLWSWVDDTPKGVTLHLVDAGLDTGPIISQEEVDFDDDETLATSHTRLQAAAETLFHRTWPLFRDGLLEPRQQPGGGSFHRLRERTSISASLPAGWDTPVAEVRRLGLRMRTDT